MTRTERAIVRHWRSIATVCAIVALAGVVALLWARADASDQRYASMRAEANRRGNTASALAGDIRVLRAQIKAKGETPAAPAPDRSVKDLERRTQVPVPVPIPGEKGEHGAAGKQGEKGDPGEPAPVITPVPGTDGADGRDGTDGQDGRDGQPPAGWDWTDRYGDSYRCSRSNGDDTAPRYHCEQTDSGPAEPEPEPSPTQSQPSGILGSDTTRRRVLGRRFP